MKFRVLSALLFAALAVSGYSQDVDNSVHVKSFPGRDVGTKLTNAMATCPTTGTVPCILVLDPSLTAFPVGTFPNMCATCVLRDFRQGGSALQTGGGTVQPAAVGAPVGMIALGDSTCAGGNNNSTTIAGIAPFAFPLVLAGWRAGGAPKIQCVNGSMIADVTHSQLAPLGVFSYSTSPAFILNDARNDLSNYGAPQQPYFKAMHLFALTRALVPAESTIQATSGAVRKISGNWLLDASTIGAAAPLLKNNGAGEIDINITTTGGPLYLSYEVADGNSGSANVFIDGAQAGTVSSGTPGTAGNCICTIHSVHNGEFTTRYQVGSGPHVVRLVTTGTTGSGLGFAFLSLSSPGRGIGPGTPVAGPGPTFYTMGANRLTTYHPGDYADTFEGFVQQNVTTLQNDGLKVFYTGCGIAGNYSSFPASPIQPTGCSDVTSWYVRNDAATIASTAWDNVAGTLTVVTSAQLGSGSITTNDTVLVTGTTANTSVTNGSFWNVVSISGTAPNLTYVLTQPGFSQTTWATTAETGMISPDMFDSTHPNSNGYLGYAYGYNLRMNLPGGAAASSANGGVIGGSGLCTAAAQKVAGWTMDGTEKCVFTSGSGTTVTLPTGLATGGEYVLVPSDLNNVLNLTNQGGNGNTIPAFKPYGIPYRLVNFVNTWWDFGPRPVIGARGFCTGAPNATTVYLYNFGETSATTCTVGSFARAGAAVMPGAYIIVGGSGSASAAGLDGTDGVVKISINGGADKTLCTYGATTTCTSTPMQILGNAGDYIVAKVVTETGTTLQNPTVSILIYPR